MSKNRTHVLDASTIIKLVIAEQGSDMLVDYCGDDAIYNATSISFSEAIGYLRFLHYFQKAISDEAYMRASNDLMAMLKDGTIVVNNANLYETKDWLGVEKLISKYSIDISHAFQVYAIKNSFFTDSAKYPNPILITGDANIALTLASEGVRVWNCIEDD